jgi:hypothetical protein
MVTPTEINEINAKFWEVESRKAEQRMSDPLVRSIALDRVASDFKRYIPAKYQISLEAALVEAEQSKRHFSQRGGRADKSDALQDFILAVLRKQPKITVTLLLEKLRLAAQPGGPIEEVTNEEIAFVEQMNKRARWGATREGQGGREPRESASRSAPISGLKDRLSRARKKLKRRAESRLPDIAIGLRHSPGK